MERNVMGELNVYRGSGAKPNFSEIARRHGMDRHTVAKYWREGESAADGRSARGSAFDPLEEVIRAKAQLPGMTKMAVYAFLREGRGEGLPGYGAFTAWCRARDVPFGGAGGREPHPRFETPPGRQLQFDWKEGMRLVDSEGEVFEFSVFTATLGYSRKHRFIPVRSRTLDDLLSCLLATFTRLGGVPEECITDNMSCLVTVSGRRRTRQERAWRFAREAGFELRLCAPRSPQTKGKDESANRFLNRLLAYGGEFTGWSGLAEAVARVEAQANSEPNRTTGLPPDALFMREKESLRPIGNLRLLESMVGDVSVQTVPPTMLVRAAGREWSVPRRLHRPARERRGDARRPGRGEDGRRGGRRPRRRVRAVEANQLRPRPLWAGPRGEAGPGRRGHRRGRARKSRAARLARRGVMGAVAEGSPSIRAQANLSALGLHEMAASLPDYVRMVAAGERGFASALEEMTRVEVAAREVRITNQRIRSSGFPYVKGLADFDWDFQPSVPRAEIEELATLRFVERAENVLFVGSPGVGKTHLAVALGIEAVKAGREVRFVDCARPVEDLEDASSRGILKKRLKYYAHSRLLIIDELGYLDVGSAGADLLFQLISTRYEQRSTIITTNVGISGWGRVFGDDVAASAIADRVCHHCHLVKITGRSYRLKDLPRDGPVKP